MQSVRDFFNKTERMPNGYLEPEEICHMDGITNVKKLISLLSERDWQENEYHYFYANCQAFAEYVYSLATGHVSRVDKTLVYAGVFIGCTVCLHFVCFCCKTMWCTNVRHTIYILFVFGMIVFMSRLSVTPNVYVFHVMDNMWKYNVFLDVDVDQHAGNCSQIAFEEFILDEENVDNAKIDFSYRYPLVEKSEWLDMLNLASFYPYVVFKTNDERWWSLEENGESIIIQRGFMMNDGDVLPKSTQMASRFLAAVEKDHKGEIMFAWKMIQWFVQQKEMHNALSTYLFNYVVFVALLLFRIQINVMDASMFDGARNRNISLAVQYYVVFGVYVSAIFIFFPVLLFNDNIFNTQKAISFCTCFCICYFVYICSLLIHFHFLRRHISSAAIICLIGFGIFVFICFVTYTQIF